MEPQVTIGCRHQSHGVAANPEAFWGLRPRFESWWDYFLSAYNPGEQGPSLREWCRVADHDNAEWSVKIVLTGVIVQPVGNVRLTPSERERCQCPLHPEG